MERGGWHLLKAVETWTDLGHGFIELRRLKFGSARAYGSESELQATESTSPTTQKLAPRLKREELCSNSSPLPFWECPRMAEEERDLENQGMRRRLRRENGTAAASHPYLGGFEGR